MITNATQSRRGTSSRTLAIVAILLGFSPFAANQATAAPSSTTAASAGTPKQLASLSLSEANAKRLGGDRLRLEASDAAHRTFVVDSRGKSVSSIALSIAAGGKHRVDCKTAEGAASLIEDRDVQGGTRVVGSQAAVQRCKSLTTGVAEIGLIGWQPGPDAALSFTNGVNVDPDVQCEMTGGKCKCKCEHGWNPFGAAFCLGFMLVGNTLQDCNWGTLTCPAPASACE